MKCYTLMIVVALCSLGSVALAGDTFVTVKSKYTVNTTLSDLYVYGANGERLELLKAGDASDDRMMTPGQEFLFNAPFEVKRAFVSRMSGTSEIEAICLELDLRQPREVSFMFDPETGNALVPGYYANFQGEIPVGGVFRFENGVNPNLPGLFVGTVADLNLGQSLGTYTGQAFFDAPYLLTITPGHVPEPGAIGLLIAGNVAGTMVFLRRRRTNCA